MKMKRSIQIVLAAAAIAFMPTSSAQDGGAREPDLNSTTSSTPARLWEVTGGKNGKRIKPIYLLAVTHLGLPAEYDHYLETEVLSALKQADVFMDESAPLHSRTIPECKDQTIVSRKDRETIDRARTTAQRMFATILEPLEKDSLVPNIHQISEEVARLQVEHLSEYGIIVAMREYRSTLILRNKKGTSGNVQIADYLKEKKFNSIYKSIDTPDDIVQIYCDLGRERFKHFTDEVEFYGNEKSPFLTPETVAKENSGFREILKSGFLQEWLDTGTDTEHRAHICNRNSKWLKRIEEIPADERAFLALGVAHFFPLREHGSPCEGILHDLKKEGYSINLIQATN